MKIYAKKFDENKFYYFDKEISILHRNDGPAIELANGTKLYYYKGEHFPEVKTDTEWLKTVKFLNFR